MDAAEGVFSGEPFRGRHRGSHSEDTGISRHYVCKGVPIQWNVGAILVHTKCYDLKKKKKQIMIWWKHMRPQGDIISKVFWFLLSGEIRGRRERTTQVPNLNFLTLKSDEFTFRDNIPANFLRSHGAAVSLPSVCSPLMHIIAEAPPPTLAPKTPLSRQLPSFLVSKLKVTIASSPVALCESLSTVAVFCFHRIAASLWLHRSPSPPLHQPCHKGQEKMPQGRSLFS